MAFPNTVVRHYKITTLDHIPLILNLFGFEPLAPKAFKFESFWTREASCYGMVAKTWNRSSNPNPT